MICKLICEMVREEKETVWDGERREEDRMRLTSWKQRGVEGERSG